MSDFNIQFEEQDQSITLEFEQIGGGAVKSVNGKTGVVVLDAEDVGAYVKPSGGIPKTDLASSVQTSLGKADSAYQKPSGGIPANDIASGVVPAVDNTLTVSGAAADAKKTGDEIATVKDGLSSVENNILTDDIRQALLQIASKVAYIDEDGQDYYDALESALYPPADLVSISCVYTQSGTVYDTDTLDSLKSDLVVTAHMSDSTTQTVTAYTLSGTLTAGTSTITVSYSGKTATFTVTVTSAPTLSSISAVYTQSGTVYDTDTLDSLKDDLVVTAHYSDSTTQTVSDYTLSGTLAEGTSTITVSYGGKTTTFNVTVTDASIMSITQGNITNSLSETDRVTVVFNQTAFNPSNVLTFTAVDGYQVYVFDMNAVTIEDEAGTAKSTNKLNVYAVTSTGVVYSGNQVKNRLSFTLGWDTAKTITCTATDFSVDCTGYGIMIKTTDGSALTPQQARSAFTKVMG